MSLESVACNRCGSLLDVPPAARFITCRACNSSLSVQRSATSVWTEPTTEDRLERLEENVDRLASRDELDRLDRQWEREREEYMISNKHGVRSLPNKSASVIMGVVVSVFGAMWMIFAFGITSGFGDMPGGPGGMAGIFPFFGLVFIAFGVGMAIWSYQRAEQYEQAKARYEQRRAQLESELRR